MIDMFTNQVPYGSGRPDGVAQLPLQQLQQVQQTLQQFPILQQLLQQQFQPQQAFSLQPFGTQPFAPQGFFGNQGLSQFAGRVGSMLPFQQGIPQFSQPFNLPFGQPFAPQFSQPFAPQFAPQFSQPFGQQQFPLFEALQQSQQFIPQAFLGNLLGQYSAPIGSFGSFFGNQGLGQLAGRPGSMLPFQQGIPQFNQPFAPQFSQPFAPQFSQPFTQPFGQQFGPQFGQQFGQPQFPHFEAFQQSPQFVPQSFFGNQGLGQTISALAGRFGSLQPFQQSIPQFNQPFAQPFAPQFSQPFAQPFGQAQFPQLEALQMAQQSPQFPLLQQLQLAQQQLQQFPVLQHLFQQGPSQFASPQGAIPPTSLPIQFAQQPGIC